MSSASEHQLEVMDIEKLVDSLSPWQLMTLRLKLRKTPIDTSSFASFDDLPLDLVLLIVTGAQLSLRDVIRCQQVSRKSRASWRHPVVVRAVCQCYFPGLVEYQALKDGAERDTDFISVFTAAAKTMLHPVGRGCHRRTVRWEPSRGPESSAEPSNASRGGINNSNATQAANIRRRPITPPRGEASGAEVLYCGGLLAWAPDYCSVLLDNLNTGQCRLIRFNEDLMRGARLLPVAMTEELIVLRDRTQNKILVHHIASGNRKYITLPNAGIHCYAYQDTIVILGNERHGTYFRWNHPPTSFNADFNIPISKEGSWGQQVIFHPVDPNIFFVVFALTSDANPSSRVWLTEDPLHALIDIGERTLVAVAKYDRCERVSVQKTYHYSTSTLESGEFMLCCKPASSYGLYLIAMNGRGTKERYRRSFLLFSTITERFYKSSAVLSMSCIPNVWNGRLFWLWNEAFYMNAVPEFEQNHFKHPCIFSADLSIPELTTRPQRRVKPTATEVIGKSSRCHLDIEREETGFMDLFVDNNFVVAFTQQGYNVWTAEQQIIASAPLTCECESSDDDDVVGAPSWAACSVDDFEQMTKDNEDGSDTDENEWIIDCDCLDCEGVPRGIIA